MGLAEPRKRTKFSHDPNNLSWSNSTTSYGQRILSTHGWEPGTFLGAKHAKHSSHYGAASASHIRIIYKDDNLGLGAQSAGKLAEQSRHVDAFQGLLGRLNGKSEAEIEKAMSKGDDLRLALYVKGRWGGMDFVRGGVLVQSDDFWKIDNDQHNEDAPSSPVKGSVEEDKAQMRRLTKEAKRARRRARKLERAESTANRDDSDRLSIKSHEENSREGHSSDLQLSDANLTARKVKSARKSRTSSAMTTTRNPELPISDSRKRKKDEGAVPISGSVLVDGTDASPLPTKMKDEGTGADSSLEKSSSSDSITLPRMGRHLLRQKNIQSKRMAFLDASGLDGIFMKH